MMKLILADDMQPRIWMVFVFFVQYHRDDRLKYRVVETDGRPSLRRSKINRANYHPFVCRSHFQYAK